jgi:hypothetical protein
MYAADDGMAGLRRAILPAADDKTVRAAYLRGSPSKGDAREPLKATSGFASSHLRGTEMKRFASLITAVGVTAGAAVALPGNIADAISSRASDSLPTIAIAMNGRSIAVSGTLVSGAVNIRSTAANERFGEPTLVHLDTGVSYAQAFAGIGQSPDPNAVSPYGSIVFNGNAPRGISNAQTILQPGNYIALDTAKGRPPFPFTTFTVAKTATPATLPAANATQTAIDFGFRGPSVLHDGTLVRARNTGWLVHMIVVARVPDRAAGKKVIALLRAGHDHQAQRLETRAFFALAWPISHGAVQQMILNTKPGYYVEACTMDTQDGREHTQLGMLRLVHILK